MEEKETEKKGMEPEDSDTLNPDDFDETEPEKGDDKPEEGKEEEKPTESEEGQPDDEEMKRRAEFAKRRREKEAAEKAKREREEREARIRREAAEKAGLGLVSKNPYTGKPIVDASDLEVYRLQKEIDEKGGDPIQDLPEAIAEKERQAAKQRQAELEEKRKAGDELKSQIAELRQAHPDVNTAKLADDPDFMEVASEKDGRWSMLEIYEESERRKASRKKPADDKKAEELAKKQKQPSASGNGKNPSEDPLASIKTREDFDKYWKGKYHS